MESNAQNSFDWEPTHGEARLSSGSTKIVVTHDGSQVCLSLLLTSELVGIVNRISILVCQQKEIFDAALQANQEALNTEVEIQNLEESLVSRRTRSHSRPIEQKIDIARARLNAARRRHAELEGECKLLEREITPERGDLETMLETAFDRFDLMKRATKPLPHSGEPAKEPADSSEGRANDPSLCSKNGSPPRTEDQDSARPQEGLDPTLHPFSIHEISDMQEKLQEWLNAYHKAEYAFEIRKDVERENIAQREQHIANGIPRESRTEFDLRHVEREIELTRHLLSITQGLERIKAMARQYGVFTPSERFDRGINEWEAPGYHSEPSEGSQEDETPEADPEMNARIERWQQGAGFAGFAVDGETRMDVDLDEWDAETVRVSESGSMIDDSWRRAKIDEWRETCGLRDRRRH